MEIETNRLNYDSNNMTLFLMPTIGCNFVVHIALREKGKCLYGCKNYPEHYQILNNSSAKKLSLHWYGGEPLLRFDLIKEIYEGITKETSLELVSNSIITNGYLVNDNVLDFLSQPTWIKSR